MNVGVALDIMHKLVLTTVICVSPFLIITMIIGIVVSLLQTVTSIQDQALAFVPKLFGVLLLTWILSNWLFRHLFEFTYIMIEKIGDFGK